MPKVTNASSTISLKCTGQVKQEAIHWCLPKAHRTIQLSWKYTPKKFNPRILIIKNVNNVS